MECWMVVLSVLGVALARPDVSELSGYNYNNPGGSPSGSYLPGLGSGISGDSSILGGSNILGGSVGPGLNQNSVQDHRHVYFYAAPDDEETARLKIHIAPSAHRSTKVIFIKAPSTGSVVPEVVAPQSQAEDKTLVYVLVKKSDQGGAITIPSSIGVKQAKPEVYFIKYRNQHEAEQAVANGLSGQPVGSGVHNLADEQKFVKTLQDGPISGGSSILGGAVGGSPGIGSGISVISDGASGGSPGTNYGTPGASGPY